jgi:hypothetical protein
MLLPQAVQEGGEHPELPRQMETDGTSRFSSIFYGWGMDGDGL